MGAQEFDMGGTVISVWQSVPPLACSWGFQQDLISS
jgi:hypothetical protein